MPSLSLPFFLLYLCFTFRVCKKVLLSKSDKGPFTSFLLHFWWHGLCRFQMSYPFSVLQGTASPLFCFCYVSPPLEGQIPLRELAWFSRGSIFGVEQHGITATYRGRLSLYDLRFSDTLSSLNIIRNLIGIMSGNFEGETRCRQPEKKNIE